MVRNRSSKARIWCEARTRIAISSRPTGSSPRVPRCIASISSPIQRASSSPSQWPIRRTFSPSRLGPERLAQPALVGRDHARGGGEDMRGRAVVLLQPDHLGARENPSRSAGCCPPRRRASHRSTGRRRPRSRCSMCPPPAAAARDTARRWCPDTRPRGCSGTSAGIAPARRHGSGRSCTTCSSRSPKSTAFSCAAAPGTGRRARRPCRCV
jgi:hypothetical protein